MLATETATAPRKSRSKAAKAPAKPETVGDIAKRLMAEHDDVRAATEDMVDLVQSDTALYRELMDPLVRTACYSAITAACRRERKTIWTARNYDKAGNGGRVETLARATILLMPLPGGKLLKDATADDLREAADRYQRQADDMAAKARFFDRVAAACPRGKVGKHLTEEQLEEIHAAAVA